MRPKVRKILRLAKGFQGRSKNCYRLARPKVQKGLLYAYRSRKIKKRVARRTWITQINAASRMHGLPYGKLVFGMKTAGFGLNRKILADLAQNEPLSFQAVIDQAIELGNLQREDSTLQTAINAGMIMSTNYQSPTSTLHPVVIKSRLTSTELFDQFANQDE